ncbi:MAG: hypothetical protein E7648_02235 [Ruminococcaceae bacterium]|nr:hypothetical protein [Oscillospiraceae bacterium]
MTDSTNTETKATETKATAKKKLVKIRIPRERDRNDDVFVCVNGRTWLIKRGVEVEVPECVAEVIRNAEAVAEQAFAYEESVKNT